jgi:hypothetical protein
LLSTTAAATVPSERERISMNWPPSNSPSTSLGSLTMVLAELFAPLAQESPCY